MFTWQELLNKGTASLEGCCVEDAAFDAEQLILKIHGGSRASFLCDRQLFVSEKSADEYNELIRLRSENVPLQYLLGEWDFYESTFYVGEGVLIPRSETEELVDICADLITRYNYRVIYDLCAGSGCIGLSIAKKFPHIKCYLFELFDAPIEYIRKNTEKLKLNNVELIRCDVLNPAFPVIPMAGLIVSNPPYVASAEIRALQPEVLKEPITALDGGVDGLTFYKAISDKWLSFLAHNGSIAFECGEEQADSIRNMLTEFYKSRSVFDLYGAERFVVAEKYLRGDI